VCYKFGITKLAMTLIASGPDRKPWCTVQKLIEKVFGHSIVNIKIYTGDEDTNTEWPRIDQSVQRKQRGRIPRPIRIPRIKKDARSATGATINQANAASLLRNNEAPVNTMDVPRRFLSSAASPEEQPPLSGTFLANHKKGALITNKISKHTASPRIHHSQTQNLSCATQLARRQAPRTMACEPPPLGVPPTRSTQTWQTSRDNEAPAQTKGAPNRTNPSSASPEVGPLLPGASLGTRKQGRSCIYSEQTSASDNTISSFTPHSRQNVRIEKSTLHKKSTSGFNR
jgi:hypothetical protein